MSDLQSEPNGKGCDRNRRRVLRAGLAGAVGLGLSNLGAGKAQAGWPFHRRRRQPAYSYCPPAAYPGYPYPPAVTTINQGFCPIKLTFTGPGGYYYDCMNCQTNEHRVKAFISPLSNLGCNGNPSNCYSTGFTHPSPQGLALAPSGQVTAAKHLDNDEVGHDYGLVRIGFYLYDLRDVGLPRPDSYDFDYTINPEVVQAIDAKRSVYVSITHNGQPGIARLFRFKVKSADSPGPPYHIAIGQQVFDVPNSVTIETPTSDEQVTDFFRYHRVKYQGKTYHVLLSS